jgi:tetratricopeptide (TPR) repeat protein
MNNRWISIVEGTLSELIELRMSLMTEAPTEDSARQLFYVQVLIAYFRQEPSTIDSLVINNLEFLNQNPDLKALTLLRLQLRKQILDIPKMNAEIEKIQLSTLDPLLHGEFHFVRAHTYHAAQDYQQAEIYFLAASAQYSLGGAKKKSVRAHFSSVATYSSIHPEARLFPEYINLYRKAMEIQDFQTAATSLLNISREFQRLDALVIALEYAEEAITIFDGHNAGSREHGLALLQKSHVLMQLNRIHEGQKELFIALAIANEEVQSSCRILAEKYNINVKVLKAEKTIATWEERRTEAAQGRPLGKHESLLLKLLAEKPRSKFELIAELYQDNIEIEFKEGRLKNLLVRARARLPGLIVFQNDLYKISDPHTLKNIIRQGIA